MLHTSMKLLPCGTQIKNMKTWALSDQRVITLPNNVIK
uniref:Uncharacterized protein n=1 Tax=Anguilla anguilla TaxID=7936 RepID=A0A0E9VAA4_ANGAN